MQSRGHVLENLYARKHGLQQLEVDEDVPLVEQHGASQQVFIVFSQWAEIV